MSMRALILFFSHRYMDKRLQCKLKQQCTVKPFITDSGHLVQSASVTVV